MNNLAARIVNLWEEYKKPGKLNSLRNLQAEFYNLVRELPYDVRHEGDKPTPDLIKFSLDGLESDAAEISKKYSKEAWEAMALSVLIAASSYFSLKFNNHLIFYSEYAATALAFAHGVRSAFIWSDAKSIFYDAKTQHSIHSKE